MKNPVLSPTPAAMLRQPSLKMNFEEKDKTKIDEEQNEANALEEEKEHEQPNLSQNVNIDLMTSSPIMNRTKMFEAVKDLNKE